MSKHTPLPWVIRKGDVEAKKRPGMTIAAIIESSVFGSGHCYSTTEKERRANAQLIVTAVNNHAKLVEALRELVDWAHPDLTHNAKAVLAQLDGELE